MYKALANHQIKFLAAASALVLIWFFYLHGLPGDGYLSGFPNLQSGAVPKTHHGAGGIEGLHPDVLDLDAAQQLCSNFRLPDFPRDRVRERKVYDLLLINTEIELLEIRLGQMAPYIDYFIILESDRTFTDKQKPLYVEENWDLFKPYHKQMIRRTMDLTTGDFQNAWNRESASRNAMFSQVVPFLTGDQEAHEDDVLLVSDVDELFKPATVQVLRNCNAPQRVTASSKLMYYSYQWLSNANWDHPQATVYRGEKGKDTVLPDDLRHNAGDYKFFEGAWHCSYCFSTIKELAGKITSFSHTEMDKPEFKDPKRVLERVRNGIDAFDRANCTRVEHNRDVPDFLLANSEKYAYMLDRDPPNANFRDIDASKGIDSTMA